MRRQAPEDGRLFSGSRDDAAGAGAVDPHQMGGVYKAARRVHGGAGEEMKLDQETIEWIERALTGVRHGEIRLIISEKHIVKILTEDHKEHSKKSVDKKI